MFSLQETVTTAVDPSVNKCDKKKIICGACESELEADHPGIQCVQGHHYCVECSQSIVRLFFSQPQEYIPLRCVQCHIELNSSVFERQLSPQQLDFYHQNMLVLVWARTLISPNERLDNCSFCSFAVIRDVQAPKLLECQHPQCRKSSCLVCRKECPKLQHAYSNDEHTEQLIYHLRCEALAREKEIFDEALESGQKLPCPKCGLAGMKDSSCTHMTCPTCSQVWCYLCGKAEEQCDKANNGVNGIYDHNYDWHRNKNRCPMYFTQIQDVDDRWPDDDEHCLIMFHRHRTLTLLREVFQRLSEEKIGELNEHFNSLNACGFTKDEILKEDLTLINYRNRSDTQRWRRRQRQPQE